MSTQNDYSPGALERLWCRRQFFLGPEHVKGCPTWKRLRVDDTTRLSVHPDLEVYQAARGHKSITLLGYILDPWHPEAGNAEIVDALIHRLDRCEAFWTHTTDFGGRWVLVVHDGRDTIVLHDAAGLRSVYYAHDSASGTTICASQPLVIGETLALAKNPEAQQFVQSREEDDCEVYWMPGDTSMYEEVKCLLPNHCLHLRTGQPRRYWPDADLQSLPSGDAVAECSRLLRGLMTSARHRYRFALSMTAGWDSRLMLSLSRDAAHDLYCFTLAYPGAEHSRDVRIPAALLKRLGLPHVVIGYPANINLAFKDAYQRSTAAERSSYCADAQALYDHYPGDRICITGDVGEVAKCHARPASAAAGQVSARDLVALCGFGPHPFLTKAFDRWLSSAACHNLNVLDLFAWEQTAGRKQALIRAQFDIAHESFAPLNCRKLLLTMLSVSEDDRRPPGHRLFRDLIAQFWGEVLCVPINPEEKLGVRRFIKKTLETLRVYERIPEWMKEAGRRILLR